jgi:hypothetical protein
MQMTQVLANSAVFYQGIFLLQPQLLFIALFTDIFYFAVHDL